jgi:hypothetical protein
VCYDPHSTFDLDSTSLTKEQISCISRKEEESEKRASEFLNKIKLKDIDYYHLELTNNKMFERLITPIKEARKQPQDASCSMIKLAKIIPQSKENHLTREIKIEDHSSSFDINKESIKISPLAPCKWINGLKPQEKNESEKQE